VKAVLISIRPQWVELIARGVKTVDVRKTRPKLPTPFKCYIYCTLPRGRVLGEDMVQSDFLGTYHSDDGKMVELVMHRNECGMVNGKVVGEFVCDTVAPAAFEVGGQTADFERVIFGSYLSAGEVQEYYRAKRGKASDPYIYGWHISQLKIYDRPKELSEFYREDAQSLIVPHTTRCNAEYPPALTREPYQIKRAPQSWCYVEELKNDE